MAGRSWAAVGTHRGTGSSSSRVSGGPGREPGLSSSALGVESQPGPRLCGGGATAVTGPRGLALARLRGPGWGFALAGLRSGHGFGAATGSLLGQGGGLRHRMR
jgi:hypothetical protein